MKKLCSDCEKLVNEMKIQNHEFEEKELRESLLEKAVSIFLDKHFKGGSKADREDYASLVSAKDIYDLREVFLNNRKGR